MDARPTYPAVPREVDIGRIERELRALWADQTNGQKTAGQLMRACTLNLVVVLWKQTREEDLGEVLATVSRAHPARIIVVTADPSATESIARGWVALRCEKPDSGGMRVCHEEIAITLSGDGVKALDNVVLSILVADLPTFLWWNGRLPETAAEEQSFGTLATNVERLVMDSLHLGHPQVDLAAMTLFAMDTGKRATLGDLNYHRITAWRQILAGAFDPPEMRRLLAGIRRVHVDFARPAGNDHCSPVSVEDLSEGCESLPMQVLLYLGWLASRLEWRFADPDAVVASADAMVPSADAAADDTFHVASFNKGERDKTTDVVVTARALPDDAPPGNMLLRTVEVESDEGSVVIRHRSGGGLECIVDGTALPRRTHTAPQRPMDLASVLSQELAILSRNLVYERALQYAEHLFSIVRRRVPTRGS